MFDGSANVCGGRCYSKSSMILGVSHIPANAPPIKPPTCAALSIIGSEYAQTIEKPAQSKRTFPTRLSRT